MGKLGIIRDHEHRERVKCKCDAVETLKALKLTWEVKLQPDHPYVLHLGRRIHKLEVQLKNMRP